MILLAQWLSNRARPVRLFRSGQRSKVIECKKVLIFLILMLYMLLSSK